MASFDIVNEPDLQEVDNAVNNSVKEIANRYDFRGSTNDISFDRKSKVINITAADNLKLEAIKEILQKNFAKRNVSPKIIDPQEAEGSSHGGLRMKIVLKEGLSKELAKKIVKDIKDLKTKCTPAIQGETVRVSGKKIDELQGIIQHLKQQEYDLPLQFVNMKS